MLAIRVGREVWAERESDPHSQRRLNYSQDATLTGWHGGDMGDTAMYTDCADGHATERVSGKTADEFVNNVKRHLGMIHKGMPMPTKEQILATGKKG